MSKSSVKVRGAYDDDYNSDVFATVVDPLSLTKQSFKDECDINNLVSRWQQSGSVGSSFNSNSGMFADVSEVPDYHTALNIVLSAQKAFSDLPSPVRDRFKNDPGEFLSFFSDPANHDEAVSLGLTTAAAQQPQELSAAAAVGTAAPSTTSVAVGTSGASGEASKTTV